MIFYMVIHVTFINLTEMGMLSSAVVKGLSYSFFMR